MLRSHFKLQLIALLLGGALNGTTGSVWAIDTSASSPALAALPPRAVSQAEIQSLGCLVVGASTGTATVLLSGTAVAFMGGGATAGAVAIPVLTAAITAGCALGAQGALGVVWLIDHRDIWDHHDAWNRLWQTLWPFKPAAETSPEAPQPESANGK